MQMLGRIGKHDPVENLGYLDSHNRKDRRKDVRLNRRRERQALRLEFANYR